MASPKFRPWWVLWICVCPWLICAPKCSNYALNNLLFGLCRFVWVSEVLVNLPNPISEFQHAPLPPKCYEPRSMPQLLLLPLSSPLDSQLSPLRSLGVCHRPYNRTKVMWKTNVLCTLSLVTIALSIFVVPNKSMLWGILFIFWVSFFFCVAIVLEVVREGFVSSTTKTSRACRVGQREMGITINPKQIILDMGEDL